jgi:hypothetical protein
LKTIRARVLSFSILWRYHTPIWRILMKGGEEPEISLSLGRLVFILTYWSPVGEAFEALCKK